jgi:hypothetical protein
VQGQTALLVPLGARDLSAVEAAGTADLDPLGAEAQGVLDGAAHGAPERDAALQLAGHVGRDQVGVDFRALNLLNVDVDVLAVTTHEIVTQLVHLGALATDDDSGASGQDVHAQLVGGAFDVDGRHRRVLEALAQLFAQLQVLVQQFGVVGTVCVPPGAPGVVVPEPESIGVRFLSHLVLLTPRARRVRR